MRHVHFEHIEFAASIAAIVAAIVTIMVAATGGMMGIVTKSGCTTGNSNPPSNQCPEAREALSRASRAAISCSACIM